MCYAELASGLISCNNHHFGQKTPTTERQKAAPAREPDNALAAMWRVSKSQLPSLPRLLRSRQRLRNAGVPWSEWQSALRIVNADRKKCWPCDAEPRCRDFHRREDFRSHRVDQFDRDDAAKTLFSWSNVPQAFLLYLHCRSMHKPWKGRSIT